MEAPWREVGPGGPLEGGGVAPVPSWFFTLTFLLIHLGNLWVTSFVLGRRVQDVGGQPALGGPPAGISHRALNSA